MPTRSLIGAINNSARDAFRLIALDRAVGGRPKVLKTEFKRCTLCARPLLGAEAATCREVLESDPNAKLLPCGLNCAKDRELKNLDQRSAKLQGRYNFGASRRPWSITSSASLLATDDLPYVAILYFGGGGVLASDFLPTAFCSAPLTLDFVPSPTALPARPTPVPKALPAATGCPSLMS